MVGADNGERLLELRQERVRMMRTLTEAQGEAARAKAAASAERSAAAQRRASQRPSISQYGNTEADAAKASLESMFSLEAAPAAQEAAVDEAETALLDATTAQEISRLEKGLADLEQEIARLGGGAAAAAAAAAAEADGQRAAAARDAASDATNAARRALSTSTTARAETKLLAASALRDEWVRANDTAAATSQAAEAAVAAAAAGRAGDEAYSTTSPRPAASLPLLDDISAQAQAGLEQAASVANIADERAEASALEAQDGAADAFREAAAAIDAAEAAAAAAAGGAEGSAALFASWRRVVSEWETMSN